MSDIIDEINEDIESEKFLFIVKKYGKYVLYVSCIVLLVVSVFIYKNHRDDVRQQKLSQVYYSFLSNVKAGLPKELSQEKNNVYSSLARIDYAMHLRNQKMYKESLDFLFEVIKSSSNDEMRNLAGIHAVLIAMKSNLVEENYKIFADLGKSTKAKAPFADLLIWVLAEMEISRKQEGVASELLNKIDQKSAHQSIKLLYDIAKGSINFNIKKS